MAQKLLTTPDPGCKVTSIYRPPPQKRLPVADLRLQALWSSSPAICNAHVPPRLLGAFIYDHLGRVEQTYVAKGHLFLFIKFMASPRLHTVKTGRIGPKASCRLTASDARTSVNSVGAVRGNQVRYNSNSLSCYEV